MKQVMVAILLGALIPATELGKGVQLLEYFKGLVFRYGMDCGTGNVSTYSEQWRAKLRNQLNCPPKA